MKLIFIHGPAACGKYTVGKALQEITGFRFFHNHLVVDTLLEVFPFGSPSFVRLREEMWLSVFEEAGRQGVSLIFTFAPEATVRPEFIDHAQRVVATHGGEVKFVELLCSIEEQERRIASPSREKFQKLKSLEVLRHLRASGASVFPPLPSSGLRLDTTTAQPPETARRIAAFLGLPRVERGAEFVRYPKVD